MPNITIEEAQSMLREVRSNLQSGEPVFEDEPRDLSALTNHHPTVSRHSR